MAHGEIVFGDSTSHSMTSTDCMVVGTTDGTDVTVAIKASVFRGSIKSTHASFFIYSSTVQLA
jgi:hypothetical protein